MIAIAIAIAIVITRIMLGMKFLHDFGFIHDNQKPNNVFSMSIIDFKLQTFGDVNLTHANVL
jgi:serine/threonine protein kinase